MLDQTPHLDSAGRTGELPRPEGVLKRIPARQLVFDRFSVRLGIEPESERTRLGDSLARDGQAQPLIVIDLGGERYEVVAGTRRARSVPPETVLDAILLPSDTPESILWRLTLAENQHRRDLGFLEHTIAFARTFDAVACSECPAYQQMGTDPRQRLRAYRNRLLNQAKSDRKAAGDPELDAQVAAVFGKLMVTQATPVSAKTFFPRHLRVLDLPPEILPDVAGLSQNDLLALLAAFEARQDTDRPQFLAVIKDRAQNGKLTSSYIQNLINATRKQISPRKGITLRFDSFTSIDQHSGVYNAKGQDFLVIKLSGDAAADRQAALVALKHIRKLAPSAGASRQRDFDAGLQGLEPGQVGSLSDRPCQAAAQKRKPGQRASKRRSECHAS